MFTSRDLSHCYHCYCLSQVQLVKKFCPAEVRSVVDNHVNRNANMLASENKEERRFTVNFIKQSRKVQSLQTLVISSLASLRFPLSTLMQPTCKPWSTGKRWSSWSSCWRPAWSSRTRWYWLPPAGIQHQAVPQPGYRASSKKGVGDMPDRGCGKKRNVWIR